MTTIDLAEARRMLESTTDELGKRRSALARAVDAPTTSEDLLVNGIAEVEGSFMAIEDICLSLAYNKRSF